MEEDFLYGSSSIGQLMVIASGYDGEEARRLIAIGNQVEEILNSFGIDAMEYAGESALYADELWATQLLQDYENSPEVVAFQLMGGQTADTRPRVTETPEIENRREENEKGKNFFQKVIPAKNRNQSTPKIFLKRSK